MLLSLLVIFLLILLVILVLFLIVSVVVFTIVRLSLAQCLPGPIRRLEATRCNVGRGARAWCGRGLHGATNDDVLEIAIFRTLRKDCII